MAKTVKQALIDAIHYPIPIGFVENTIIERKLNESSDYTYEVSQSKEFKGALADCLYSLLQAVSIHESDKSVGTLTDKDKERLLFRINNLYEAIGEEPVQGAPMVYIGG